MIRNVGLCKSPPKLLDGIVREEPRLEALADELHAWFEVEGLTRRSAEGDESGEIVERICDPVIALGPGVEDFVTAPHPASCGWPGRPLHAMSLDAYNVFLFRWLEAAAQSGLLRCAHCGRPLLTGDDLPDPETWDAIFIEKELVAWMGVHFDCKRWLAKRLKGLQPFELSPGAPPHIDLAMLTPQETERPSDVATIE